jgi:hypothetical protein
MIILKFIKISTILSSSIVHSLWLIKGSKTFMNLFLIYYLSLIYFPVLFDMWKEIAYQLLGYSLKSYNTYSSSFGVQEWRLIYLFD